MKTDAQSLLIMAVIGIVAGFLASLIVGGGGGLIWYLFVGLIGAFVGGLLLSALDVNLGIKNEIASRIVTATIGAVVVIVLARLIA
ncbi:MAG: GlsB/YeaQ/YmgE family stress response membrane protein [Pseudomonadota bacterium]|jgi:uncharacterized membrane protein YeaQ/YmgE (transglycosylase-associated protein family)|nr:MAG: GlsB/YeaQ/YmgE family stress response membrane protein [Pseudomonadota bacterium]